MHVSNTRKRGLRTESSSQQDTTRTCTTRRKNGKRQQETTSRHNLSKERAVAGATYVWVIWYGTAKNYPWAHDQNSSLKHVYHQKWLIVKELINLCIMGGGRVHWENNTPPMSMPTTKLDNKLSVVGCARVQVTLLESMIFSSCLNSSNLASYRGLVNISANCSWVLM